MDAAVDFPGAQEPVQSTSVRPWSRPLDTSSTQLEPVGVTSLSVMHDDTVFSEAVSVEPSCLISVPSVRATPVASDEPTTLASSPCPSPVPCEFPSILCSTAATANLPSAALISLVLMACSQDDLPSTRSAASTAFNTCVAAINSMHVRVALPSDGSGNSRLDTKSVGALSRCSRGTATVDGATSMTSLVGVVEASVMHSRDVASSIIQSDGGYFLPPFFASALSASMLALVNNGQTLTSGTLLPSSISGTSAVQANHTVSLSGDEAVVELASSLTAAATVHASLEEERESAVGVFGSGGGVSSCYGSSPAVGSVTVVGWAPAVEEKNDGGGNICISSDGGMAAQAFRSRCFELDMEVFCRF